LYILYKTIGPDLTNVNSKKTRWLTVFSCSNRSIPAHIDHHVYTSTSSVTQGSMGWYKLTVRNRAYDVIH